MNTSFFKRQRTWVGILFVGLVVIIGSIYLSGYRIKSDNYLPLQKYSDTNETDTGKIVLSGYNFGFEIVSDPNGLPDGWGRWGHQSYSFTLDTAEKHTGKYALRIESNTKDNAPREFGCPRLAIPVNFTGATVTVKAMMKLEGVERPIGLLLRIDGDSGGLQFDNMQQRGIKGTRDWAEYTVTLPLPENAKTIYIGAILSGPGKLWIDDFQVIINQKQDFNFGFENVHDPNGMPDDWFRWGDPSYQMIVDTGVKHSGKNALRIEAKDQSAAESFGCPARAIPAQYKGSEITVKAFMRTEGVEQPIGLMLRIDGKPNESLQFDNMVQRGITGSKKWEEYTVTLPLPEEAITIYVGAILSGKGKLWVDDFQLLIDGEDISKAKLKPKKTFKADEDVEFDAGSKIKIKSYTPQTVVNLELLGRIWGFLKYYHPAVAAGDYNWDAELFRIMPKIINVKNTDERNMIFVDWIDRLGKLTPVKVQETVEGEIKLQIDFSWAEKPELGKTLSNKLNEVKKASRGFEHYYIALNPSVRNPNFKNERPYAQMNYADDSGMRLLALFRYWNMIEYFFPYKHLTDKNWNSVLGEFIPRFLDGATELDYKQALLQLIAHVNDTHANIYSDSALDAWKGTNIPPYEISFIEEKAVVTSILKSELKQPEELKKGDIITRIGEKTIEQIVEARKPYSPASNPPVQMRNIARELLRTNANKIPLQIIRDGVMQNIEITCLPLASVNKSGASPKASYQFISPEIGYIWPETLKNDSISFIMEKFAKTKGIIIDFRCYPRTDFTVFTLGAWLTQQPTDFVKFTKGSIEQPGTFAFTDTLEVGNNKEQCYRGKVVIIVNEQTQSSAEYHTMAFQTAPTATVIGSVTAGADGNVSSITLPGRVSTMITGIGVYYPDGRETQRIGVALDMEVKPTIQGIIDGRDELLEKAIQIIHQ